MRFAALIEPLLARFALNLLYGNGRTRQRELLTNRAIFSMAGLSVSGSSPLTISTTILLPSRGCRAALGSWTVFRGPEPASQRTVPRNGDLNRQFGLRAVLQDRLDSCPDRSTQARQRRTIRGRSADPPHSFPTFMSGHQTWAAPKHSTRTKRSGCRLPAKGLS